MSMALLKSRKILLLTLMLLAIISASAGGNSHQTGPRGTNRFDPDGTFWIQGTPPQDFSDIGGINLNSRRLRRFPAAGIDLVGGRKLPFKSLTVRRDNLTFSTAVVRGVSYTFSGRFLKGGVFSAGILDPDTPVLEGTLTKWRGGRKVAEEKLKFTYFGGT